MPNYKSRGFVISETSGEIIDRLSSGNYSRALNAIIGRYDFMVAASVPDLVDHEWKILIEVLPKEIEEAWTIGMIEHPLRAKLDQSTAVREAQVDPGQFAAKIARLGLLEKMAIVHTVDSYRAAIARGERIKPDSFPWGGRV